MKVNEQATSKENTVGHDTMLSYPLSGEFFSRRMIKYTLRMMNGKTFNDLYTWPKPAFFQKIWNQSNTPNSTERLKNPGSQH